MFAEWVAHGAQIGITAFIAIIVFALCCMVALGVLWLLIKAFGWEAER